MAELTKDNKIKPIAFYLPQYHSIPENDKAWGKGFTEWENVKNAVPLFENHNQPRIPLDNRYYNLLHDETKIWQSNLAQKYGVYGFCYYHYWFKGGKMLLEKPAEQMLQNKEITIPFCFSWANENWSKKWDGGNKEIIAEQDYGSEKDWISHINYLLPFLKDERYITYQGCPIFLIYKPELIPNLEKMMKIWNDVVITHGIKKICFIIQNCGWYFSPFYNNDLFDFQVEFEPFFSIIYKEKNMIKLSRQKKIVKVLRKFNLEKIAERIFLRLKNDKDELHRSNKLSINDYEDVWNTIISIPQFPKLLRGVFCDWDNTPRSVQGRVFSGTSPDKFKDYLHKEISNIKKQACPVLFINAWNEWGEGTYLEPDIKNGYSFLEAIRAEVDEFEK